MNEFELLTTQEVAQRLHVDPSTVRRWRLDGVGPRHIRVNRLYRYPVFMLDEWVRERLAESIAS